MRWAVWIIDNGDSSIRKSLESNPNLSIVGVPGFVDGKSREAEANFNLDLFAGVYGRAPSSGEIGCSLAHLKAYDFLVSKGLDGLLILEDDALVVDTHFPEFLDSLSFKEDNFLVHLHCQSKIFGKRIGKKLSKISTPPTGTYAYLISKLAAVTLLEQLDSSGKAYWQADWPPITRKMNMYVPTKAFFAHDYSSPSLVSKGSGRRGLARVIFIIRSLLKAKKDRSKVWALQTNILKRDLYRWIGLSPN